MLHEWDWVNNTNNPTLLTSGCSKDCWWICSKCKYEWLATPATRNKGHGCPLCAGKVATKEISLASLYPEIATTWHPRNKISPEEVRVKSGKKVWWLCQKCHLDWESTINDRVTKNSGCPYCSGRKVSDKNRLSIIAPEIAKEWHPVKNGNLTPNDVSRGCGKKVWWLGKCGHEWPAQIGNRTKPNRTGCPKCKTKKQTKLFDIIRTIFPDEDIRYNYQRDDLRYPSNNSKFQIDIYIPNKKLGENSLEDSKRRDNEKREVCQNNGIRLIEIDYTWDGSESIVRECIGE